LATGKRLRTLASTGVRLNSVTGEAFRAITGNPFRGSERFA